MNVYYREVDLSQGIFCSLGKCSPLLCVPDEIRTRDTRIKNPVL